MAQIFCKTIDLGDPCGYMHVYKYIYIYVTYNLVSFGVIQTKFLKESVGMLTYREETKNRTRQKKVYLKRYWQTKKVKYKY